MSRSLTDNIWWAKQYDTPRSARAAITTYIYGTAGGKLGDLRDKQWALERPIRQSDGAYACRKENKAAICAITDKIRACADKIREQYEVVKVDATFSFTTITVQVKAEIGERKLELD